MRPWLNSDKQGMTPTGSKEMQQRLAARQVEHFCKESKRSHSCKREEAITLEAWFIFSWCWQLCITYPVLFLFFQGSQARKAFGFRRLLRSTGEHNLLRSLPAPSAEDSGQKTSYPWNPESSLISSFSLDKPFSPRRYPHSSNAAAAWVQASPWLSGISAKARSDASAPAAHQRRGDPRHSI